MSEIVFVVEEAPEGGYVARAVGDSIFTEADTLAELHERARGRPLPFRRRQDAEADPAAFRSRRSHRGMKIPRDVSGAKLVRALAAILGDVAAHHGMERDALVERLFGR